MSHGQPSVRSNTSFIIGIIVMTVITEYDRYKSNLYFDNKTKEYEKQADDILRRHTPSFPLKPSSHRRSDSSL
jgi:hypothetical protein